MTESKVQFENLSLEQVEDNFEAERARIEALEEIYPNIKTEPSESTRLHKTGLQPALSGSEEVRSLFNEMSQTCINAFLSELRIYIQAEYSTVNDGFKAILRNQMQSYGSDVDENEVLHLAVADSILNCFKKVCDSDPKLKSTGNFILEMGGELGLGVLNDELLEYFNRDITPEYVFRIQFELSNGRKSESSCPFTAFVTMVTVVLSEINMELKSENNPQTSSFVASSNLAWDFKKLLEG